MTLSKATLNYFDVPIGATFGRGENLNLLFKDAGIEFEYVRHKRDGWLDKKQELVERGYYPGTLPAVEFEGKVYGTTVATMRYFSRRLGKYLGSDIEQEFYLDQLSDTLNDWVIKWAKVIRSEDEEALQKHKEENTDKYLDIFNKEYGKNAGPYLLGSEISYVDILVYHQISDDRALKYIDQYPNLATFVETFTNRPNLKAYFASLK